MNIDMMVVNANPIQKVAANENPVIKEINKARPHINKVGIATINVTTDATMIYVINVAIKLFFILKV